VSKIVTETEHLVTTTAVIMKTYVLIKASNVVHLKCCRMTKKDASNYIL
jgi:hypothetical protein